MPTYQYACTSCGERLEVVQKFSDDPLTVCPACSGALRKVFSPVGVVFKGSGFYKTDSRSSGARKNADTEKKDAEKKDPAKKDATTSGTASKETKTSESTSSPSGASPTAKPSSSGQVA